MPSAVMFEWFGYEVSDSIHNQMYDRLVEVGEWLVERIQENINTPYPPHSDPFDFPHKFTGMLSESMTYIMVAQKRSEYIVSKTASTLVGSAMGIAGSSANMAYKVASSIVKRARTVIPDISVLVGVREDSPANVYAPYLEFGTSNMEPRPFLWETLMQEAEYIRALVGRPLHSMLSGYGEIRASSAIN